MNEPRATKVGDFLNTAELPNPTIPVPFEKFAHLKSSNDMLERAAFWAYYAAWTNDHDDVGHPEMSVEARHDGHTFAAIMHDLHLRDCVMLSAHDYTELLQIRLQHFTEAPQHAEGILWIAVGIAFLIGTVVGVWLW